MKENEKKNTQAPAPSRRLADTRADEIGSVQRSTSVANTLN